jgi:16S rRNA (guanine527-N7)-methyltransferase
VTAEGGVFELASRHRLPPGAGDALLAVLKLIERDEHAPTTIRDPLRGIDEHLADSLVALQIEEVRHASVIADLGAGAGFPGLPLAIALPRARVALVESSTRKCEFLERAVGAAGARNLTVVHSRAEEWTEARNACDLVTARALAPLAVVAEYAAPLLRVGGVLLVWRGRRDPRGEAQAELAAAELGLEVHPVLPVVPFAGAQHRHLHLMLKVRGTPSRFPRRPGAALKRPLGSGRAPATSSSDRPQR